MGQLIYSMIMSLDGYVADNNGNFDWAAPDDEAHAFINDLERPVGTYLYGRRMYETMLAWDRPDALPDQRPVMLEFAEVWRAADKIVYSTTLEKVATARTRLEREFDLEAIQRLKTHAATDLAVGGPTLAAHTLRAGLVDQLHLFVAPSVVGGGLLALPNDARMSLELLDNRRFGSGMIYLHYRIRR